ncbi:aldo/keto reductase [Geomonas paludis]|uniref:Oxidoreductase n=1 Tax=Geomonas paludis TaxID=2740185 RepID=A0A6V8MUS5_9BACT|nr:aldo/keto reductase [Geomonas paludis]GFO63822.1 oxidoreductase [Geomonas paludis]
MSALEQMPLGGCGVPISRLGMGCWAVGGHGWGAVDESESLRAIRAAYERGVTFFDTADAYGVGKSEELLARALEGHRKEVVIATKGGVCWSKERGVWIDISPSYLRSALEKSLARLKLDHVPLYYVHKPDGITPIQDSVGELERLREEGKIGAIGISNFSCEDLERALKVAPISAMQVKMNVFDRKPFLELSETCARHNVTLVAWGALADGLLTGKFTAGARFPSDDHRSRMPEFCGAEFERRLQAVARLKEMAGAHKCQVGQLALRWVLDRAPFTCSLFGAKTELQVRDNLGCDGWSLTSAELDMIDAITGFTQEVT